MVEPIPSEAPDADLHQSESGAESGDTHQRLLSECRGKLGMLLDTHEKDEAIRLFLEENQYTLPISAILVVLREHGDVPDHILEQFDHSKPILQKIQSPREFTLNPNRRAYTDVQMHSFAGPDNMEMTIQQDGPGGPFEQKVFMGANHGEIAAWLLAQWLQLPELRPAFLLIRRDGHGDEMGSDESETFGKDGEPFFALAMKNDQVNGISSFLSNLAKRGVIQNEWYFGSLIDKPNDFYYIEKKRFMGGENGLLQHDLAPEHGIVRTKDLPKADIYDIDVDYLYHVGYPEQIAWAIRQTVEQARKAKYVTSISSPGWMDEELGVLYAKLHVELIRPKNQRDDAHVEECVRSIYARLEVLGKKYATDEAYVPALYVKNKKEKSDGSSLYYYFGFPARSVNRETHIRTMIDILQNGNCDDMPRHMIDDKMSFYAKDLGTIDEKLRKDRRRADLEMQFGLAPALLRSPWRVLQELGREFSQIHPVYPPQLQAGAYDLPNDNPAYETDNTHWSSDQVDLYVAKIADHVREGRCDSEQSFKNYITLLIGALKVDMSEQPLSLKHSILAFLSRLGRESGLFDYQYRGLKGQQSELHNWRQRITGIDGIYADPTFVKQLNTVVTLDDIADVLNVDGGGRARLRLKHGDTVEEVDVCFKTAGQGAPELYAHSMVQGVIYRDETGRIVSSGNAAEPGVTEWQVLDRNVGRSQRSARLKRTARSWERGEKTAKIPVVVDIREKFITSLQKSFIAAKEAWDAFPASSEKYDEMKPWVEKIFAHTDLLIDDVYTWDDGAWEAGQYLDGWTCQLHGVLARHSACKNPDEAMSKKFLRSTSQTMIPEPLRAFLHKIVSKKFQLDIPAVISPHLPGLDRVVEVTVKDRR